MLSKWCIVICDLDEVNFALIGPFDTKACAEEVDDALYGCDVITSIHPFIQGLKWVGNARRNEALKQRKRDAEDEAYVEAHEEYRKMIARQLL